jgi:flavin reductase (DIM6/NTAB) family NADH-FMN oxidoreductase RutF
MALSMKWEDKRSRKFVSNIGIISSNGKYGYNFMSCEWTHHLSYEPAHIVVSVNKESATLDNIRETGYFGVSILNENQALLSSVCGNVSGKDVNKLELIKALGYEIEKAKNIDVYLIKDACLKVELRVKHELDLGDHVIFIGEVLNAEIGNDEAMPLVYSNASYWKLNEKLEKPNKEVIDRVNALLLKFSRNK